MALDKALEKLKYDKRMLEFNLKTGEITKEQYDKFLQSLNDDSSNALPIELEPQTANGSSHTPIGH